MLSNKGFQVSFKKADEGENLAHCTMFALLFDLEDYATTYRAPGVFNSCNAPLAFATRARSSGVCDV